MQKIKCSVGRENAKNAVFIGENDIFYLEKNEANWQFRIRQQRSRLAYYHPTNGEGIQRMVRDFSSAKHQRAQPMKNVLGVF